MLCRIALTVMVSLRSRSSPVDPVTASVTVYVPGASPVGFAVTVAVPEAYAVSVPVGGATVMAAAAGPFTATA